MEDAYTPLTLDKLHERLLVFSYKYRDANDRKNPSNYLRLLHCIIVVHILYEVKKCKVHPCTGTEALYRPYGPYGKSRYSSILS